MKKNSACFGFSLHFFSCCTYLAVFVFQIFYFADSKGFPDSPQFKTRVEWAGDVNKKDGSIRINKMQFADNGTYACDVKNPPDIAGKPSLTKLRVVKKGKQLYGA